MTENRLKIVALLAALMALLATDATANAQAREKVPSIVPLKAALFPLEDVRLLDSPFKQAQETDRAYLLRLEPDRLLAWMRQTAGLTPKAPHYDGWDNGGAGTVGHYLSAVSQMAQATGDPKVRQRVDYVVAELAACQQANGDGALYPSQWDKNWFAKLAQGQVDTMNTTPWYTTHKTLAGLRDAYLLCGNAQARDTLVKMADWCVAMTLKLTDDQWQQMLGPQQVMGEFGGPHEILADVYSITGDRKYLQCAEHFRHNRVFDPLERGDASVLNGQHANAQIPKFVGYERIYELSGDPAFHRAALNFWTNVTQERSWANGGDSQWEHFFAPDEFSSKINEVCGPETCNTYNMLKLTQELYTLTPSAAYMDYYERALYDHILPSEAPGGGFVYYTPMRPGHYRVYSRPFDAFWCCVGTGMENHGKYGEMIYAHAGANRLFVNLFLPSTLAWKAQGLTLRQETTFPQEPKTRLALALAKPRQLTISIRYPAWVAASALQIRVNGSPVKVAARPGSYADIGRVWKTGDRIDIALPMRLRTEMLPGSRDYAAFLYGPILLAGPLGTEGLTRADFFGGGGFNTSGQLAAKALPLNKVPVLVGNPAQMAALVEKVPGPTLAFRTKNLAKPGDVSLVPFYEVPFQRYALYWHVVGKETYVEEQQARAEEARDAQTLETRTIDRVRIGEADSETAHHLQAAQSNTGPAGAPYTHWRDTQSRFSYQMTVLPDQPVFLRCAYWGSDSGRVFDVQVGGQTIAVQNLTGSRPDEYLPVTYAIPTQYTQGKTSVTVQFVAHPGNTAGGLFDCRTVRK